jgi:pimeloyl-ACP methyl ester carboxylesterase
VCAVDRRGRGRSGDSGNSYEIEQEFADVAAVVDSLTRPADLFGHSYGATVALGAALLARNLRRLVLYEPTPGVAAIAPELLARLDALLARDLRDELLRTFMVELVGFGPDELEQSRPRRSGRHGSRQPTRSRGRSAPRSAISPTRRVRGLVHTRDAPAGGSESPRWARRGTEIVQSLLSNSHVVVLQGQGHVATLTAPELLAGEVARFLHDA